MNERSRVRGGLRERASTTLERIELHRSELLALSRERFAVQAYAEFRAEVDARWRAWRSSPTALLLVGISHHLQHDYDRAREFVAQADEIWSDLGEFGLLDRVTLELVRSSLAGCRAKILQAEGRREDARRLLHARIAEVESAEDLGTEVREELLRYPLELLQGRRELAERPMTDLVQV